MTVEKVDGCAVLTCPENTFPYVLGSYEGSELPKADGGEKDFVGGPFKFSTKPLGKWDCPSHT